MRKKDKVIGWIVMGEDEFIPLHRGECKHFVKPMTGQYSIFIDRRCSLCGRMLSGNECYYYGNTCESCEDIMEQFIYKEQGLYRLMKWKCKWKRIVSAVKKWLGKYWYGKDVEL